MLLNEHDYCVAVTVKVTERVQQQMCIKFCIKLKHSSMETIQMIQKATAMDIWWLAASSQQCACSCIMSPAVVWWNIKSPRGLSPLQPRFGALQLLAFPKTKMIFEREEISDRRWDSGKYHGAAHGDWETCVRSQGAYIEGDWGIIVLCTIFLASCIILNKCLYFSYYMVGYFLDRPHILGWNFLDWKKITYLL